MVIITSILIVLLVGAFVLEFGTDLLNEKNSFFSSIIIFCLSIGIIYHFKITAITDKFEAAVIAAFLVSGIYFFYSIASWFKSRG